LKQLHPLVSAIADSASPAQRERNIIGILLIWRALRSRSNLSKAPHDMHRAGTSPRTQIRGQATGDMRNQDSRAEEPG
jgi:hypothetical protein